MSLAEWLEGVRCAELSAPLDALGVESVEDLTMLEPADIESLVAPLKQIPARKFREGVAKLQGGGAAGTAGGAAGGAAVGAAAGDQGSRVASGLGPLVPVGSLTALFRDLVHKATPLFLDAIQDVEDAGIIPGVLDMAEVTMATAKDQKQFGALKDDPLPLETTAYIMKYTAEDSVPTFYGDMNNKCYDKDRKKIAPYGKYMVGLVKHMKEVPPYPNTSVTRGVKADLKADYPEGREFTWYGFCSTTKSVKVLENPQFCGTTGKRTIFTIALTQGQARDITRYSLVGAEDEVLLPPGCRFVVESVMDAGNGLTLVQVKELPSKEWIVDISPGAAGAAEPEPEPVPEVSEEEQKVRQFCSVCGVDESTAHQQLESAGWDVQTAVDNFLAAQAAEEERRKRQEALAAAAEGEGQAAAGADGAVATDEASLLAAARAEGKVLVAPGTVITLTKKLFVCENPDDSDRHYYHCVERAALTIAAAGGGAKILGPQGEDAVLCYGAAVVLQGLAVECRGGGSAVLCTEKGSSKGRAELSGCTLTSPEGQGLWVVNGSTATMDGGSISGSKYGVYCISGSTATLRGVTLERNRRDYYGSGKIVVDGVEK